MVVVVDCAIRPHLRQPLQPLLHLLLRLLQAAQEVRRPFPMYLSTSYAWHDMYTCAFF